MATHTHVCPRCFTHCNDAQNIYMSRLRTTIQNHRWLHTIFHRCIASYFLSLPITKIGSLTNQQKNGITHTRIMPWQPIEFVEINYLSWRSKTLIPKSRHELPQDLLTPREEMPLEWEVQVKQPLSALISDLCTQLNLLNNLNLRDQDSNYNVDVCTSKGVRPVLGANASFSANFHLNE